MRLHRFIGEFDLSKPILSINDPEICHQIARVLRLKVGESVILCDGQGREATALLKEIGKTSIHVELSQMRENENEPKRSVTLYCSILKRENFEWVVQKATEAGVKEMIPILTARTVKTNLRLDRLQKIAKEAAEQSGRGVVPVVREPREFEGATSGASGMQILFHTGSDALSLTELMRVTDEKKPASIGIWIGPEGGFTEEEVALARKSLFLIGSLGTLTLRGETAAVVASFVAVNCLPE